MTPTQRTDYACPLVGPAYAADVAAREAPAWPAAYDVTVTAPGMILPRVRIVAPSPNEAAEMAATYLRVHEGADLRAGQYAARVVLAAPAHQPARTCAGGR